MSKFLITSVLRVDEPAKASKTIAGLKLANKSNFSYFQIKPRSGLFSKKLRFSHFGPPTAPKRIASE